MKPNKCGETVSKYNRELRHELVRDIQINKYKPTMIKLSMFSPGTRTYWTGQF